MFAERSFVEVKGSNCLGVVRQSRHQRPEKNLSINNAPTLVLVCMWRSLRYALWGTSWSRKDSETGEVKPQGKHDMVMAWLTRDAGIANAWIPLGCISHTRAFRACVSNKAVSCNGCRVRFGAVELCIW